MSTMISSAFNRTQNRAKLLSPQSGMCSLCDEDCGGSCEIGLAAVLGAQTVYPTTTGSNQVASEKDYPIDFSHFNINGRVFGAQGVAADYESAGIFGVSTGKTYGKHHPVQIEKPLHLPALIKLNWRDYFSGAAMAGISCVIGESAKDKDSATVMENGVLKECPMIVEALERFNRYDRGFGQIILQCNVEDDMARVPEFGLRHGYKALEFKFGQAAKGTQPVKLLPDLEMALKKQAAGVLVRPDPTDPAVQEAYAQGVCPNFYSYGRLPLWDEEYLTRRIAEVRQMGAENIYFKMAGYDREDLERVLRLASALEIDMVTFDGAGGGSGYSPCKMMNEWCLPTICLEAAVMDIAKAIRAEGGYVPGITITGGFASEDQVFKALALGDGLVTSVGLCRATMAAAMSGSKIGALAAAGNVPERYRKYGDTVETLFADLPDLRALYGKEANQFPTGAIGVFSYLNKINFGLKHFGALNRKFDLDLLSRRDLIPLTAEARQLLRGEWFDY